MNKISIGQLNSENQICNKKSYPSKPNSPIHNEQVLRCEGSQNNEIQPKQVLICLWGIRPCKTEGWGIWPCIAGVVCQSDPPWNLGTSLDTRARGLLIFRASLNTWALNGVLVFLKFAQFSSELTKTWSSGATECRVWIGNCNVKVWKSTKHKPHKTWRSLKFCVKSGKRAHPQ